MTATHIDSLPALPPGPWFHNLHLPDGRQTRPDHPLGDFPACNWGRIAPCLPADLHGWSCLDIGCNAGFYTFELARRGADVLGIDLDARYLRQAQWAAAQFGLRGKVRFVQMQLYELAHRKETFDLVWFMGVFYHLRYPLLGLDIVTRKVNRLMVFQTMSMPGEEVCTDTDGWHLHQRDAFCRPGWPTMAFIEHRFADDPTNWWAPNYACVEAMLRSSGMRVTARPAPEIYICEPNRDQPSCIETWNASEYLAATHQPAPAAPQTHGDEY